MNQAVSHIIDWTGQGGLVLTQTRRDAGQLAIALDAAYAHLRAHRPGS